MSIVVPAYNGGDNVFPVARRLGQVLADVPHELVFSDEGTDDTAEKRGPGTAVVRGLQRAGGTVLAVMDADPGYPPELVVDMLAAIEAGADLVVPGFPPGGPERGRKASSAMARCLGKAALSSLRPISDPAAGCFMFRRPVIEGVDLRPASGRILIEILVRGKYASVVEIPCREKGGAVREPGMSWRERWNYLRHLGRLARECPKERRFYTFALAGLSAVLVTMAIYYWLVRLGTAVPLAGTIAAVLAMFYNFFLNDTVTWPDVRTAPRWKRLLKYGLTSAGGIGINIAVLSLLYYLAGTPYLPADLTGIAAGFAWNYTVNSIWTWRAGPGRNPGPAVSRRIPPAGDPGDGLEHT